MVINDIAKFMTWWFIIGVILTVCGYG